MHSGQTLGKAIALLRREADLSVEELAARAGLRPERLAGYEAGVTEPRWETLERLLAALEVGPGALARALETVSGQPLDEAHALGVVIRFHQQAAALLERVFESWPDYVERRKAAREKARGEGERDEG